MFAFPSTGVAKHWKFHALANAMEELSLAQASPGLLRNVASLPYERVTERWAYRLDIVPVFFGAVSNSRHFVIAILSDS